MKVLFTIRTLLRAGAERLVVNLANELVRHNEHEVAIYTVHPGYAFDGILDNRVIVKGGDVEFHFSLYKKNKIVNNNYIDFVNEFKPDIIHSHLHFGDLLAHSYHYKSAKYFSHQHNSEVPEYKKFNWVKFYKKKTIADWYEFNWIKKQFKSFKTQFIACSAGTELLLNKMIKFSRVYTFPNAVPLPEIIYQNKQLQKPLQIIWVGRFSDVKRPHWAVKIADQLKKKGVVFKLTLVGDGPRFGSTKQLVAKCNLDKEVELLGAVDKIEDIYNQAHLMIHTSVYEGLPMVFIEANSYGIPILSTDCMPNNEFLKDGVNGRIIKDDDLVNFANEIEKMISDSEYYEELSANSVLNTKRFGIKQYTKKIIEIYNS